VLSPQPSGAFDDGLVCPSCDAPLEAVGSGGHRCSACGATFPLSKGIELFAEALAEGDRGYDPWFFARLAEVEEGNFWFRSRSRLIEHYVKRYVPRDGSLLEIGCGTGYVLSGIHRAFPGLRLSGSELHVEGLAFAQRRVPEARFFQADARRLPFRGAFDAIGAFDVLEHIEDDGAVLAGLHRALRPGGTLLLTVPQHPALWSDFDAISGHVRRYTRAELVQKVDRAGFEVLHSSSFMSILLPAIAVSRFLARRRGANDDPMREYKGGRAANAVLYRVLSLERSMIELGLRFPIGSSRLVIARRRAAQS
jgi:SAM-dependent methyltransferase